MGGGGVEGRVSHPFSQPTSTVPSYNPLSTKGVALEEATLGLIAKGTVELAPLPSPGFYSRLFVVWKTSGSRRPVIDLSHLNRFVDVSHFKWRPSSLFSCRFVRMTGWPPSISRRCTSRFRFTWNLVPFSALFQRVASSSSKLRVLASPQPLRSSLGSWLLYLPFFMLWVSACAVIWTTGSSSPLLGIPFSRISGLSSTFAAN